MILYTVKKSPSLTDITVNKQVFKIKAKQIKEIATYNNKKLLYAKSLILYKKSIILFL